MMTTLLRRLLVLSLLLLVATSAPPHLIAQTTNLVAFWELDNVNDAVGSNTLTNNNSTPFVAGLVGNSGDFNGSNQTLTISDNAALSVDGGDVTVQAWVDPDSVGATTVFVTKGPITGTMEYGLFFTSSNVFTFRISSSLGVTSSVPAAAAGGWYHVVGRWNDATNDLSITVNNTTSTTNVGAYTIAATTTGLVIGADSGATRFTNGRIDQVGVWKTVLSDSEISVLYNSGSGISYADMQTGGGDAVPCTRMLLGVGCDKNWMLVRTRRR